jgi:hypothetical protein
MGHKSYTNRQSYFDIAETRKDAGHDLGFDYHKNNALVEKTLSGYLFGVDKRQGMVYEIGNLMVFLIDSVKNIKKTFVYSVSRNSRNIN